MSAYSNFPALRKVCELLLDPFIDNAPDITLKLCNAYYSLDKNFVMYIINIEPQGTNMNS